MHSRCAEAVHGGFGICASLFGTTEALSALEAYIQGLDSETGTGGLYWLSVVPQAGSSLVQISKPQVAI